MVDSLALQQIKEVGAVGTQETSWYTACTYKIEWYTILMLSILLSGFIIFVIIPLRKLKPRRHLFSNAVIIMLLISDTKYYVPIKLCKIAGSIHLFKTVGTLTFENVKLKQNSFRYNRNKLEGSQCDFKLKWNQFNKISHNKGLR